MFSFKVSKKEEVENCLLSKYSAHSAHYLGMIFITRERIALLESKFSFQLED